MSTRRLVEKIHRIQNVDQTDFLVVDVETTGLSAEIGRASCRERV